MLGMVQKKLYRTTFTLNVFFSSRLTDPSQNSSIVQLHVPSQQRFLSNSGKCFRVYEVVRVSYTSRSRLVSFPKRNLYHKPLTFPIEHALDRDQVAMEIMMQISPRYAAASFARPVFYAGRNYEGIFTGHLNQNLTLSTDEELETLSYNSQELLKAFELLVVETQTRKTIGSHLSTFSRRLIFAEQISKKQMRVS